MALISQEIKNLVGGISQQPDNLRFSEQGEQQINAFSSETDGLQKRPPTVFVKRLGDKASLSSKPLVHLINRDSTEQYYVVFTGTGIKVFDLKGKEFTVTGDMAYATVSNPRDSLRMITVADYTFIVNKSKIVANGTELTPAFDSARRGIVNVRGGQYGRTLQVAVNGIWTDAYTLPNGSTATDINAVDAQAIVVQLAAKLRAKLAGWTINEGEGYIEIIAPASTTITGLQTKDGYNNDLISPVWKQVSQVSKLPLVAPDGYVVKISGVANSSSDDYYVKFQKDNRIWKECPAPSIKAGLDTNTMPHVLIRQSDGSFEFTTFSWGTRKAGDLDTNPDPSFVGQSINDIFYFSNRLGFLSGENVILSRPAKYGEFYVPSVSVLSDDDPIDVATSDSRINILKYAVPFSEQLLLWSNDSQFVLSKNGTLTTKSINVDLSTNFSVSDYARPFGLGRGVYFCSPRSTFSSINRFYAVQDVTSVNNADDITAHVPNYIENGVFSIAGSNTENFITILTEGNRNSIFVYKFLYIAEQIRQQSWSSWEFPEDFHILACNSINSKVYVLFDSNAGVYLETLDFTQNTNDLVGEPYRLYVDGKVTYTIPIGNFDNNNYITRIDLNLIYGGVGWDTNYKIILPDGFVYDIEQPTEGWNSTNSVLKITGNLSGLKVIVGRNLNFLYQFSKLLIKKTAEDGSTSTESSGRLQLKRTYLNYKDTGAFDIIVDNGSIQYVYNQSGALIGTNDLRVGNLNIQTGQVRFPTTGNAKNIAVTLFSDYPTPLSIVGCGWEAMYQRRTNGM
ncbi:hypothetical protein [Yersinia enterocolitica]|uniref:phage nozzle protein n=1 Tax=Yersinia enterocolitica TaxID=630 RepID=UPI003D7AF4DC